MAERIDPVLIERFLGLKNTATEERLAPEELARAQNVDIDAAGQLHRRRGYRRVAEGNFHSLHKAGERWYVVHNQNLCRLFPDYSTEVILPDAGPNKLSYVDIGDETFFASQLVSGVIRGGVVEPWGEMVSAGFWESPVVNPSSTLPEVAGTLMGPPPHAEHLTYFNGRIYLANGLEMWATELYRYHTVDKTRNYFYFESPITAIQAVTDGVYVGTRGALFFLEGNYREMRRTQIRNTGVVPGSVVVADPATFGEQAGVSKTALMLMTKRGLCLALDSGVCYDLTSGTFEFPTAQQAAAFYREQDGMEHYVGVTTASGEPTSKARFGDYVDVEIKRFKGDCP